MTIVRFFQQSIKNGPVLMILGNVFFSLLPISVVWATRLEYSGAQITFARFAFACLAVGALALTGWQKLQSVNHKAVLLRGLCSGLAVLFYFMTLEHSGAAKGTIIYYTHALWANLFSMFKDRQKPPKAFWALLAVAGLGLWLALDIHNKSFDLKDLLGLVAAMFGALGLITIKEARRTDNTLTVFASFAFFGLFFSALLMGIESFFGQVPGAGNPASVSADSEGILALLSMGALAMTSQIALAQSLAHTSIAFASLLSLSIPIQTTLFSLFILGERITPQFVAGGALILGSCAVMIWQDTHVLKKPPIAKL